MRPATWRCGKKHVARNKHFKEYLHIQEGPPITDIHTCEDKWSQASRKDLPLETKSILECPWMATSDRPVDSASSSSSFSITNQLSHLSFSNSPSVLEQLSRLSLAPVSFPDYTHIEEMVSL